MVAIGILFIKILLSFVLAYVGYILIGKVKQDKETTWKDDIKFIFILFGFLFLLDFYSVLNLHELLK